MPCDSHSTMNRSAIISLVCRMEGVLFFSITVNMGPCVVVMGPQGRWVQNTHHHTADSCTAGLLKSTVDFVWARNKLLLCWGTETVGCFLIQGCPAMFLVSVIFLSGSTKLKFSFCVHEERLLWCIYSPVGVETAPYPWAWVSHLQSSQVPMRK